jgi:hypothetical protein
MEKLFAGRQDELRGRREFVDIPSRSRHSRAGGNRALKNWIPACAGMTRAPPSCPLIPPLDSRLRGMTEVNNRGRRKR